MKNIPVRIVNEVRCFMVPLQVLCYFYNIRCGGVVLRIYIRRGRNFCSGIENPRVLAGGVYSCIADCMITRWILCRKARLTEKN